MPDNGISMLPNEYQGWRLKTHHIDYDESGSPDSGYVQYEYYVNDETQFSIYIERDGPDWAGSLLDTGEPENPHRDPVRTTESESFTAVLSQAKAWMDSSIEQYIR